ncbi:MAG: hypothetical protein ABEK59_07585 [Halobacteria archaeon]
MEDEVLEEKLDEYIQSISENAIDEFSPSNILDLPTDIGDDAVKSMARPMLNDELEEKNESYRKQYSIVIKSVKEDETDNEKYIEEYLDADPFYGSYTGNRPRIFKADLLDRMEEMQENIRPLVEADGDTFDERVVEAFDDEEKAAESIKKLFNHSEAVEPHRRGVDMKLDLDMEVIENIPFLDENLDYSKEAIRIIEKGENMLDSRIEKDAYDAFQEHSDEHTDDSE